jgi:hypothetical protein
LSCTFTCTTGSTCTGTVLVFLALVFLRILRIREFPRNSPSNISRVHVVHICTLVRFLLYSTCTLLVGYDILQFLCDIHHNMSAPICPYPICVLSYVSYHFFVRISLGFTSSRKRENIAHKGVRRDYLYSTCTSKYNFSILWLTVLLGHPRNHVLSSSLLQRFSTKQRCVLLSRS